MIYLRLFYEFFKAGLFAIGGGLATLPFLQDISETTGWFDSSALADMIAVSESTPGPIGINMATYAGFQTAGVLGGIIATLGLVTPSIIIIIIVAQFLKKFRENAYVDAAFYGLRPAVTALIAAAGWQVALMCLFNTDAYALTGSWLDLIRWKEWLLFAAVLILLLKFKKHPLFYIAGSAVIGIVFQLGQTG